MSNPAIYTKQNPRRIKEIHGGKIVMTAPGGTESHHDIISNIDSAFRKHL